MTDAAQEVVRVRAEISGKVQGVFFRASVADRATELGLSGWAANTPDGRVVLQAQGPRADVDALIAYTHSGPPLAEVSELSCSDLDLVDDEDGFSVR